MHATLEQAAEIFLEKGYPILAIKCLNTLKAKTNSHGRRDYLERKALKIAKDNDVMECRFMYLNDAEKKLQIDFERRQLYMGW